VRIGSEPDVISEVPTGVVGIVVDYDLIAIPQPAVYEVKVVGRDAPVKVVEPETIRAAAAKAPRVARAESPGKTPMLIRTIEVVVGIVATGIVSDPLAVCVYVRCFGMPGSIVE
jgi:hypothetical protein